MLRLAFVTLALTLAVSAAEARKESSRMSNPGDNPTGAPTPQEFNHEEWARRRSFGLCANLFECSGGAPSGYTHLPYVRGYVVEEAPYGHRRPEGYQDRYRRHRSYR